MHGFVDSGAAIRTYAPMILGIESLIVCAVTRMNNASRITAATVFTNGRIFTGRIVLFFIGRGITIDTELPMIVGIRFIIVIIMMLNSAVCVIAATYPAKRWVFTEHSVILFGGRSATVTTYTPMPIRIVFIVVIILVLNTTAGIVNTTFCANSWLIAICIVLAFARSSAATGTYFPMLFGIMFITAIILVINIVAGIVSAASCTDIGIAAICPMNFCVNRGTATGTYIPVLISVMLIIIIIVPMLNIVAGVVNAANMTDGWFIAICGMRPFFGRSAATGACIPMLISVMLEGIIVIRVLNTTARVISATCCTATGLIAICEMSPFLGRSTATGTYQPMLISIMFITVIIFVTNAVARIVSTTFCADG